MNNMKRCGKYQHHLWHGLVRCRRCGKPNYQVTSKAYYRRGRKEAFTEVIELLEKFRYVPNTKELNIFTVNPLILEIKALNNL